MKYPELESASIEWKREIPANDQIIKTIVGFCNLYGGKLIIGIDNDGTIIGLEEEEIQKTLEYLNLAVYQASMPPIIPNIYTQNIEGRIIIIIEISAGMNKPYFIKSLGLEQGTYIRLGRSTVRASATMIDELRLTAQGKIYDKMPLYQATQQDLNTEKIQEFLSKRAEKKKAITQQDALYAYHFVVNEQAQTYPTVAGILLFGKQPNFFFSEARIMCAHFPGNEIKDRAIASRECTGTLLEQFDDAFNFVLSRLNYSWIIEGTRRKEILEIPREALREALINALVHRNYHLQAACKIAIFDNRIEIFSPGNFPGPLNQQNLRNGYTFLRNVAIAAAFRELGVVESFGIGFQKIFSLYEEMNLRTPQVIEDANFVKCILPRGKEAILPRPQQTTGITEELQEILRFFDLASEITLTEIMQRLHIPRTTATRRIKTLIEQRRLKKIGEGKRTRYRLA